jgi:hypothetical protein
MNKQERLKAIQQLKKKAQEQKTDENDAANDFGHQVFEELLQNIQIDGLDD